MRHLLMCSDGQESHAQSPARPQLSTNRDFTQNAPQSRRLGEQTAQTCAMACLQQWPWIHVPNGRKVLLVNRTLTLAAVLLFLNPIAVCQTPSHASDCSTLKYLRHEVSCLCGTVQVCSGDICLRPSDFDLDDDITVELREKSGTILDSEKVVVETCEKQGTTQDGTKTSYKETERRFCFEGKRDGDYLLAFVLHKNGVPQPAVIFPTNYSRKRSKACDSDRKQSGDSVSKANVTATTCLPLSSTRMASLSQRSYFQRTTHANGARLAIQIGNRAEILFRRQT